MRCGTFYGGGVSKTSTIWETDLVRKGSIDFYTEEVKEILGRVYGG